MSLTWSKRLIATLGSAVLLVGLFGAAAAHAAPTGWGASATMATLSAGQTLTVNYTLGTDNANVRECRKFGTYETCGPTVGLGGLVTVRWSDLSGYFPMIGVPTSSDVQVTYAFYRAVDVETVNGREVSKAAATALASATFTWIAGGAVTSVTEPAAPPVEPLLPTTLPSLTRTDATLSCAIGAFSDTPAAVDVTLVVDGVRKDTKRVESPATSTTFTYDAVWQGAAMTCEVVAKVENRVSTAYAATLTVPKPAAPTTPVSPVMPVIPEATAATRGFAVESVRFDSGSAALDSTDRAALAALVKRAGTTTATYRVTGYVQGASVAATGSPTARARAQAVAAELRRLGVKPANITTRAAGGTVRDDDSARRATVVVRWVK